MKIKTKVFLYTTCIVFLILTLSLATLYYVMPRYYAGKQYHTVEKIGKQIEKEITGNPFSEENRHYFEQMSLQTNTNIFVLNRSQMMTFPNFRISFKDKNEADDENSSVEINQRFLDETFNPDMYQTYSLEKEIAGYGTVKVIVALANQPISDASKVLLDLYPALLLASIIIGMIGAYFSSWLLTKRMLAISQQTKRMARDLDTSLNEVKGHDEIAELSHDINQLYRDLQVTIQSLNQELEKTAEIEMKKTEFMRAASHELKTPVAALGGLLDAMIYRVGEFRDRDKYLVEAKKIVVQQNQLIQDILTISKIELIDPNEMAELFSLKEVFAEILPTYYMMAKTKVLQIETAFDFSEAYGNREAFKRISHNLLTKT